MHAFLSGASASFRRNRYVLGRTRRSLIPLRWVIHSSDVVKQRASRWLSTTQSGTAIPVPMIFALRMTAFRDGRVRTPPAYYPLPNAVKDSECLAPRELRPNALVAGEPRSPLLEERLQALPMIGSGDHPPLRQGLPVEG